MGTVWDLNVSKTKVSNNLSVYLLFTELLDALGDIVLFNSISPQPNKLT